MINKICIIGLGYVGLPLAIAFAEKSNVIGFDINQVRNDELNDGYDKTLEITRELLASVKSNIEYTSDIRQISGCNVYIVTVPTPIDSNNKPDLTPLINVSKEIIGKVISKGDVVIYESTVYPGVTEEICVPEIESISGFKYNKDFFVGYSPERINPGDKCHTVKNILKVTSGSTKEIAKRVDDLYKSVITAGTYLAPSIKVAEASKIIENTQRDVNIALINELALIFDQMQIDTNEVLKAAGTKWNFIPLKPGLVGGHCIGVDPYYLTFKAEELGYKPDLILASRHINNGMGKYIAEKTIKLMIKFGKKVKNSKVLIMGVTFKENCPDIRNTRVVDIINELREYEVDVAVYDPFLEINDEKKHYNYNPIQNPLETRQKFDAVIVAVGHEQFKRLTMDEYNLLFKNKMIIIDIKGIVPNPTWRL